MFVIVNSGISGDQSGGFKKFASPNGSEKVPFVISRPFGGYDRPFTFTQFWTITMKLMITTC
jgi:hypothetical protein